MQQLPTSYGIGESHGHAIAIGVLPDDVLFEIFDLCQTNESPFQVCPVWPWHSLVHVCRRWRQIIFESPRRLNLQILCKHGTPARKNLDIWPSFPIAIHYRDFGRSITPNDEDNIIAVLKHRDRVCSVTLINITGSQLRKIATVMQEPFPALTNLDISSDNGDAPVLPAKFLGGSAPCLQDFSLSGIPYPALPTLLLSASDLVSLVLQDIPPTGYISPKEMVVSLAALPRLSCFTMKFQLRHSGHRIHPPPVARTVLPSLNFFRFSGASEYLEDLVAQIDAPQLHDIVIDLSNLFLPQIHKFIDRSVGLKLTQFRHARVIFLYGNIIFEIRTKSPLHTSSDRPFTTTMHCKGQVSHYVRVVSHFFATISIVHLHLVHLHLETGTHSWPVDWPHVLHAISAVQTLFVNGELTGHFALTLQGITGGMVPRVLPSLHLICLDYFWSTSKTGPSIEKFVNARKLCGRPVTVLGYLEFRERLESYV